MSVLFIMPTWSAPSELWMGRMIEALEPDVAFVAALRPEEQRWRGRIPTIALGEARPRLWRRLALRAGIPVPQKPRQEGRAVLRRAMASPFVTRAIVQYLDFAVRFEDVWSSTTKPLFVHCHGHDTTWDARSHEAPGNRHHPNGYVDSVRRLTKRAQLIAPSAEVSRRLTEIGVPPDRVVVKHLGVPVPERPPQRAARTKGINILYLGRLFDCKGPDLVIRAFEVACERGLDGRLVIAGEGPLRTMCELLRSRSRFVERISILGAVDGETGEKLRAEADIFTTHNCLGPLTRQEEAFGVSIVEAMGAGLPVVTGRSGGLTEHIIHGENGLFVEPGDIAAHAEALLTLASDPDLRRRMGEAAWRKVRESYSCDRERAQLREILGLNGRA